MSVAAEPARERTPRTGAAELLTGPAALAIFVWGASFVATRKALDGFAPGAVVSMRFAIGAAFIAGLQLARRRPVLPEPADVRRCALLGCLLAAHITIQALALSYTSATHSGWLVAFSPVAIALGAALFLKEPVARRAWLGILVAAAGVAIVLLARTHGFADARVGDLLVLSTCAIWATYTLASRAPLARSGAFRVTPLAMAVAAALTAVLALFEEPAAAAPGASAWLAVLFLGLGSSGIGFTAWASAIERHGATRAGTLLYFQPFVTLVLAWLVLGEPIDAAAIGGGALVLAGVALAARR